MSGLLFLKKLICSFDYTTIDTVLNFDLVELRIRIMQWGEDRRFDEMRANLGKLAVFWIFQVSATFFMFVIVTCEPFLILS